MQLMILAAMLAAPPQAPAVPQAPQVRPVVTYAEFRAKIESGGTGALRRRSRSGGRITD